MPTQIKAGIVIDSYKLPVFERRLRAVGYAFEQHLGIVKSTLFLTVLIEAGNTDALADIIKAANAEIAAEGTKQ